MKKTRKVLFSAIIVCFCVVLSVMSINAASFMGEEQAVKEIQLENPEEVSAITSSVSSDGEEENTTSTVSAQDIDLTPIEAGSEEDIRSDAEKNDNANSYRYINGQRVQSSAMSAYSGIAPAALNPNAYKKIDGQWRDSSGYPIPRATSKGIDVSEHQGWIDWDAVRNSDTEYAIIRCGYGMNQTDQDDYYWERNTSECQRLGIPYGVYIYSYATDTNRARSEAEHVLRLVRGKNLSFPIYYDLEDISQAGFSPDHLYSLAKTFCDTIRAGGYSDVQIYANLTWFNTKLTHPGFDEWGKWVAQYNRTCDYQREYNMWQCSSSYYQSGITANSVDLNFLINGPSEYWHSENGYTIYIRNGQKLTGSHNIGGYWYWFDGNGYMQTGWVHHFDNWHYYQSNGQILYGELVENGKQYYFDTISGRMATGWTERAFVGNKLFFYQPDPNDSYKAPLVFSYTDENGRAYNIHPTEGYVNHGILTINDEHYGYEHGDLIRNDRYTFYGNWYYFNSAGIVQRNAWANVNNQWYFHNANGETVFGHQIIDGKVYYFLYPYGEMIAGWVLDSEKWYYFETGSDGKATMVYGEQGPFLNEANGKQEYYYFDTTHGHRVTGLQPNGKYYDESTWDRVEHEERFINGSWHYFRDEGHMVVSDWQRINGQWKYYNEHGHRLHRHQILDGKVHYFHPETGFMITGWVLDDGKWYYFEPVENDKATLVYGEQGPFFNPANNQQEWYYFDDVHGYRVTGLQPNGKYYDEVTLTRVENQERLIHGNWYYFGNEGHMIVSDWRMVNNQWLYYNQYGHRVHGHYPVDGENYYFDLTTGIMQSGFVHYPGNWLWYYFELGADGKAPMVYGEQGPFFNPANGKEEYYYFLEVYGQRVTGLQPNGKYYDEITLTRVEGEERYANNNWYYFTDNEGEMLKNDWQLIDGQWKYYNASGHRLHGIQMVDGKKYFFLPENGNLITGWVMFEDKWYYFAPDDTDKVKMVTGEYGPFLNPANGKQEYYFFDETEGHRVTGLQPNGKYYDDVTLDRVEGQERYANGSWYYFTTNAGEMFKGDWLRMNGEWKYYNASGQRLHGIQMVDGKKYFFLPENGNLITGWVMFEDKWYYFEPDNTYKVKMVTGEYGPFFNPANGKQEYYFFDETEGYRVTGLQPNGKYYDPITLDRIENQEREIDGEWYFFQNNGGAMYKNDWLQMNGEWKYYNASGQRLHGIQMVDGKKYFFLPENGNLITGWVMFEDKWYYFAPDDTYKVKMVTGEYGPFYNPANGKQEYYFFDETEGHRVTGLQPNHKYYDEVTLDRVEGQARKVDDEWYYFKANTGDMAKDEWIKDENGNWFYYQEITNQNDPLRGKAPMVKDTTITIDGIAYTFDEDGILTSHTEPVVAGRTVAPKNAMVDTPKTQAPKPTETKSTTEVTTTTEMTTTTQSETLQE